MPMFYQKIDIMKSKRNHFILALSFIALIFTTSCKDKEEVVPTAKITSLSEGYGMRGSTITINGSDFHSSAIVYFGDVAATPTSIDPTSIVVTVPDNAAMGHDISIMQGGVSTDGPKYYVYTPAKNLFFTEYDNKAVRKIDLINSPNVIATLFDEDDGISGGVVGIALSDDGFLYVSNDSRSKILKMSNDGSGSIDVLYESTDGVNRSGAIAIDNENDMLYWSNSGSDQIMKASNNGTDTPSALVFDGKEVISTSFGLKLDVESGELYLSDFNYFIKKGNMDGTGTPEVLYSPTNFSDIGKPSNIFIDPVRGKMYWTNELSDQIVEANLDGTGTPNVLFDGTDGVKRSGGLAIDYASGKIYWADTSLQKIFRGNLDGTGSPEELVDSEYCFGMVLEF